MKVLLVQPRDVAQNYIPTRPLLGQGYLASALRRNHIEVYVFDARIENNYIEVLKKTRPDFIGYSITSLTIKPAAEMIQIAKKMLPHAKIIVGGPEITLLPKEALSIPFVDYGIAGEGEHTLPEFIMNYKEGKFDKIPGLIYRSNGELRVNPHKPIDDLDSLDFPAWKSFRLHLYNKKISKIKFPIMTSRGCPYTCMFCDSTMINGRYRVRSAKNVVDELEAVHRTYGNKNFQIMDDNFAVYKDRVMEICDEIIRRKLRINWVVGQGFLPSKASYELFRKMKQAGCLVVYFGIESADDEVLRKVRKPFTVEQVRKAIKDAKRAGLKVKAPFISGLPKSTYEKEKGYIRFFKETGIDMPRISQLIPFPGTDVYEWVKTNATYLSNDLEKIHTHFSQTRGNLGTDLSQPTFATKEYPLHLRKKLFKEFVQESEKYMIKNLIRRYFGSVASSLMTNIVYLSIQNKHIRKVGVSMLSKSDIF